MNIFIMVSGQPQRSQPARLRLLGPAVYLKGHL